MNIPTFLNDLLIKEYGNDITNKIIQGYEGNKLTTFRVNNLKSNINEIKEVLNSLNINYSSVPWFDNAFVLEKEYPICNLDFYKDGKIYVQSLSSMIPALIVNPKEKENILDMCSAPGRKNNSNGSFI